MESERSLKKDWEATPEAFEKLLAWLDADLNAAAEKYEEVRQKLLKLFKWRNCIPEEEYADITINRVTRRIYENTPVDVRDPYLYFHGTALNVIREYWRREQKHKHEDIDDHEFSVPAAKNVEQLMDESSEHNATALRFGCMKDCIGSLPEEQKQLIISYHNGDNKKEMRKALADKMKVPINVLRIKACRIRDSLQNCVTGCMKKAE